MTDKIYLAKGDVRTGPYTLKELCEIQGAGDVGDNDLVWCEGMADWVPAKWFRPLQRAAERKLRIRDDREGVRSLRENRSGFIAPAPKRTFGSEHYAGYDAVLHDCPECGRAHFVTVDACPSAEDAAKEMAMADGHAKVA